ncbi:hypothetical protein C8R45DRAFT_773178, partial [Mycena sanguinolenta]
SFETDTFKVWNPAAHDYCKATLHVLVTNNKALEHNFVHKPSAFAAATVNFGPVTGCHINGTNLGWGWCSITVLGDLDTSCGGHLVLWDLKLIIEFSAGSTVLLPSTILYHLNTIIVPGEHHYSFTQFTAANLFHWVNNSFRS